MKTTILLALISGATMTCSFLIQWLVIVLLRPGRVTDAFFASLAVPHVILAVISGSLVYVLVPLLSGEEEEKSRRDAWTLWVGVTALFSLVALLLGVSSSFWLGIVFPGFNAPSTRLLVELSRIQFLAMVLTASTAVLSAYCYSRNRYVLAESIQLATTAAAATALVFLLPVFGVKAAAWVSVLRSLAATLVLVPVVGKFSLAADPRVLLRASWSRLRPLLAGSIYFKTDPLVDRILATYAPAGGLSLYHLAHQIFAAVNQILNTSIAGPLVPRLAAHWKQKEEGAFRRAYRRRLGILIAITVTAYAGLLLLGKPFLDLIIGHGGVTSENVTLLWAILVAMGGVLIAGSLGYVTSGAFYARGDTRTPTRIGIITYSIYVPLKILAFLRFGLIGLAASTSVFVTINVAVQFILEQRRASWDPPTC
jgi:putative peptidoglycan lipid II flippase